MKLKPCNYVGATPQSLLRYAASAVPPDQISWSLFGIVFMGMRIK